MTITADTAAVPDAPERAGRRAWLGLAVLALPTLLISIDVSVLFLALPSIAVDLRPSSTQTLWIMDIYGFMVAGFLITMGAIGDRIGRRRLLLIGAATFGFMSVVAAYAVNAEMLIAARALLGVAGATLMPSTLSLISTMFRDPQQRGTAIAVWISCFMCGTIVGPLVGGVLLEHFWWGAAFLLGVPVMVVLVIAGPALLPEQRNAEGGLPDLLSVALSLGTILPVVYGIKTIANDGVGSGPVTAIAAGLVVGAAFLRRQATATRPLLDLKLFRNQTFASAMTVSVLGAVTMGGLFYVLSQYVQLVLGLSTLRAGLWLVPGSVAMLAGSMFAPKLAATHGPAKVSAVGLAISAVGFLMLTQIGTSSSPFLLLTILVIFGGMGPMPALFTDLIVGSVTPEEAGSASAVSETGNEMGIAVGIAVIGSVATAVFRGHLDLPAGVPSSAKENLASALATAGHVPGSALADAARAAFTDGLHVAAVIAAVVFVGLAVLTAKVFGGRPETAPSAVDEDVPDEPELVAA
jgi:DHA2 family multidrug resistance protein-like MFS transporter